MDSTKRSIAKAISWRVWATSETVLIGFLLTGSLKLAGALGVIDAAVKMFSYFIHERFWNRIKFGRVPEEDYQI